MDELFSSATLSNANIIERVIPELKERLRGYLKDKATVGPDGIPRYADGSLIQGGPTLDGADEDAKI